MADSKDTYLVNYCEAVFVSKKPAKEGDSIVFMFQGADYIPQYDMKITPESVVDKLTDEQLFDFAGTHKFTISATNLPLPRYKELVALSPRDKCLLEYGYMPGFYKPGDGDGVNYSRKAFISVKRRENKSNNNGGGTTEQKVNRPPAGVAA